MFHPSRLRVPTPILAAVAILMAIGTYLLDLLAPAIGAVEILYLGTLLITLWVPGRTLTFGVALLCSGLVVSEPFVSGVHGGPWFALVRHPLSLLMIWAFASAILMRKRSERALHETEERYRALIERSHDLVYVLDFEGNLHDANPAALSALGYERDEIHSLNLGSLVHPDEFSAAVQSLEGLKQTGVQEGPTEFRVKRKNGEYLHLDVKVSVIFENGRPWAVLGIARDITERKRAEERLLCFQKAVDDASDAIGMSTPDGRHYYQNRAFTRLFGLSAEDVDGNAGPASTVYADEDVGREVFAALMRGDSWIGEVAMLDKDRNRLDILLRAYAIKGDQGNILGLVGVHTDITKRKQAEEALRESEAKYRAIVENAQEWVWEVDPKGLYTYSSPIVEKVLGYRPEEIVGKKRFYEMFHPEDRDALREAAFEVFARKEPFSGSVNRNMRKDGGVAWLLTSGIPILDAHGNLLGYRGMDADISELKRVESALEHNEAKYRALIETTGTGFVILDQMGTVLDANPEYVRLTGHRDLGEISGRSVIEWTAENEKERNTQAFGQCLKEGRIQNLDVDYVDKDGEITPIEINATVVETDGTTRILTLCRDITARKQAEQMRAITLGRQERLNQLQQALLGPGEPAQKLKMITDGVVDIFSVDFCRIWITSHGDLCELGCMHAAQTEGPHVCRHRDKCLRLIASSGRYTHTDGTVHRRVPFGCYKIGRVASGEEHRFLTNDAAHDPRVHDHDWVKDLGLVSFAGYQLRPRGGETLGVLALFSKQPITPEEDAQLDALSSTTAQVIRAVRAEEALRKSEAEFRALFEGSRDATILLDRDGFFDCNNATLELFECSSKDQFTSRHPGELSPPIQPDGRDSSTASQERIEAALREGGQFFEWMHQRLDGRQFPAEVLLSRLEFHGRTVLQAVVRDITERKQGQGVLLRLAAAMDQTSESIIITGTDGAILYANPAFERTSGFTREEAVGLNADRVAGDAGDPATHRQMVEAMSTGDRWSGRVSARRKDGTIIHQDVTVTPVRDGSGAIVNYVSVQRDVTQELVLEAQLRQAQRLEAVGSLAAGIAHEINTPIQFIGDNVRFLSNSFAELARLQEHTGEIVDTLASHPELAKSVREFVKAQEAADLGYLKGEIPKAIEQTLDGVARVARIVRAMKDFSHPDQGQKGPADLNRALLSTLTVANNELKYVADVVTDFDESLPSVWCHLSDLNQVFLNLLVNAAHAIADVVGDGGNGKGRITVTARRAKPGDPSGETEGVIVSIADTGTGIPESVRDRVFEQFFTTKEVGHGTGQGLAIARAIVTEKHRGRIWFSTETGEGTTFHIFLPVGTEEMVEAPT